MRKKKIPILRASRLSFMRTEKQQAAHEAAVERRRCNHVKRTLSSKNPRAAITAEVDGMLAECEAMRRANVTRAGRAAMEDLQEECGRDRRVKSNVWLTLRALELFSDVEVAYVLKGAGLRLQHSTRL